MDTFTAIIHQEGEFFVAFCPETGTVSQGKNIEEAITNLKEATELYLEEFPASHHSRSLITTFEVASIAAQ
ncbi:MAG: type II toxin-antitoxin system HicB family antitoxin [Methanomicrobiales archaeon]|nr:type II toxin-antitoxin system HicB family antitoxin [Methanomicrobiales archaeon]